MYSDLRETKKLKVGPDMPAHTACRASCELTEPRDFPQQTYEATKQVRSALPHPRILGVIRECGGKMWMAESEPSRGVRPRLHLTPLPLWPPQNPGKTPRPTFSSPSSSTTSRARRSASRCSSTSCSRTCSWGATSTRLTRKRPSRTARTRRLSR